MATPVFVNGIPARITRDYFRSRYGQNFPDLLPTATNARVDAFIEDTYTMFYGVNKLWAMHPTQVYFDKTQLCFGHLLCWYITDMDPSLAVGIMTAGGIPLKSKEIGGIKLVFGTADPSGASGVKGYLDLLSPLKSNPFGYKAYQMIKSAGNLSLIFGRKTDR